MSRTHRKQFYQKCALRKPKTSQERKQLLAILDEVELQEYEISGVNHLHHRLSKLPHANDDVVIAAYYEKDYS
jgi:hypothetical protein